MKIIEHYIDGTFIQSPSDESKDIYNPATGKVIARLPFATSDMVETAISKAKQAFIQWSQITPQKRVQVLFVFKAILEKNRDELARAITLEHGKTLADAQGEITRGIEVIEFACGIPHALKGEHSTEVGTEVDSWNLRQPLGVCLGITPFNFPVMIALWMFPIALACGNTFILKPSEQAPSASLLIAKWLTDAGCPNGVFNVIQGNKDTVHQLITHSDIQAISFVGSTPIAQQIYHFASTQNKRVQALGGAKNHMVVMPDTNLSIAAQHIVASAFGSAGQRCMAISVVIAMDEIADKLIAHLKPLITELRIGPGGDAKTELGPLISKTQLTRVLQCIEQGESEGASLIVDGRNPKVQDHENGYFLGGCLFDHVTAEMKIYQEEIFGPVLCIMRQPNLNAALDLINKHSFGNGAAIYTENGGTARHFAQFAQAGMIGINVAVPVPVAYHSFGGWKNSLFGQSAIHGMEGVRFYTKLKTISSRWLNQNHMDLAMPTLK